MNEMRSSTKKEDRRIAGRKKASAIARPFPGKKNRCRNIPNGLTETDKFSAGKKEDRRSSDDRSNQPRP
ncbi:hypothetical protein E3N88_10435 [Mikania micrantha]|uniref:Uncharacterized protein n=1 Tax=Mikania micrantha TaxID=192012 RepID=A0A5N6PCK9_9ASTR|nr:hypothetical protein E3N88_10435 [Mikania micrantha]